MHEVTSGVLTGPISGVVRSLWHCEEHGELDETVLPTTGGMVVVTLDRHLRAVDVRVRRPGAGPADVTGVGGRRSIGIELVPGSWPLVRHVVSQLVPTPFPCDPSEAVLAVQRSIIAVHERVPATAPSTLRSVETELRAGARVADVCRCVGADRRRLARAFRQHYGVGLKRFSVLCRFERAVAALRAADAPSIATVAADAGYADQAHLSRTCVQLCGLRAGQLHRRTGPSAAHVRHDETFKTSGDRFAQLGA